MTTPTVYVHDYRILTEEEAQTLVNTRLGLSSGDLAVDLQYISAVDAMRLKQLELWMGETI